jgi:sortase A
VTAPRPEPGAAYGPYPDTEAFEAVVGSLGDPLNDPLPGQEQDSRQGYHYQPSGPDEPVAADEATIALRQAETGTAAVAPAPQPPTRSEGRAARRKAVARAAKARKENVAVIASRIVGELFITTGVLLLLFVTYQLWWTNVQADRQADGAARSLEEKWDSGDVKDREPDAFSPGKGFAIMYIPKLDVRVPIAEGIDKPTVLDRGMVGHYDEKSGLKTAMPWEKEGNFAVAGHRNTHGEPFRYINKLVAGDEIIVETRSTYYTYEMTNRLPSTSPSNVDVVMPVPRQSGFTKPGRYVTLTTCTPEFTSKYRLIVWGKMADERPRSEGKPDALVE